jgi:glycosyltransferase involved in cell wall biosynthesis
MVETSVIIPTYNRAEILRLTLAALVQQSHPRARFEVIVVDDGSTDQTAAVVQAFQGELNLHYCYLEASDHSVSKVRNLGIEQAQGEVLLFLDSDMIVCPAYVEEHLKSHKTSGTPLLVLGYVYGYRYTYEVDGAVLLKLVDFQEVAKNLPVLRAERRFGDPREIAYRQVGNDLSQFPAPWRFVWSNSISLRKEDVVRMGGFDETFPALGGEDTELGYRCFKQGLQFQLNRRAWGVHYPHPIDVEARKDVSRNNRLLFYRKYPNPEIELYTVTRRYTYNRLLGHLQRLIGRNILSNYGDPRLKTVWNTLRLQFPGSMLVIGGGQNDLICALEPSVVADFDHTRLEKAQQTFHGVEFRWTIGVRLLYPDRSFDRVVITDVWRGLPRICIGRLLREAVRVGKEVVVLCTPNFEPSLPDRCRWHQPMVLSKLCQRFGLTCDLLSSGALTVYQIAPAS